MQSNLETQAQSDERWMRKVLDLAEIAAKAGEIPVGAIIVHNGELIAQGFNLKECQKSSLAHAEILAIDEASQKIGGWRLMGCTLYVNLEPCSMCAGAILQARIERVVYGTRDPKTGAVHSMYQLLTDPRMNHQAEVVEGVLAEESRMIIQDFFAKLRAQKRTALNSLALPE